MPTTHLIGVISDTHGLLRPEAVQALRGVELIIHAGDVGRAEILDELGRIAPVQAVRGNVDGGAWAERLPMSLTITIGEARIHVVHILAEIGIDPVREKLQAVIYGHSHAPEVRTKDEVMYLNPGSAGPRRFRLPITMARLKVTGEKVAAEIVKLL